MSYQSETVLDETDWRILAELQADGRLSYNELGRRVHMSSPAVAERVRRLERLGVVTGYRAAVDARRAGYPVEAFIQMRCTHGRCLLNTSRSDDFPEVVEIHKLSGDHCTMLRVRATSVEHFEGLVDRLGKHGEMRTSMVLSTQYQGRAVEPPGTDYARAPRSAGWGG